MTIINNDCRRRDWMKARPRDCQCGSSEISFKYVEEPFARTFAKETIRDEQGRNFHIDKPREISHGTSSTDVSVRCTKCIPPMRPSRSLGCTNFRFKWQSLCIEGNPAVPLHVAQEETYMCEAYMVHKSKSKIFVDCAYTAYIHI